MSQLYIFDMDGTIIQSATGQFIAKGIGDQMLMPGVAEKCAFLIEQGHTLAVASNQGGVAFGFKTLTEAHNEVEHATKLIGAKFFRLCPYHPNGTNEFKGPSLDRKPNPGMLFSIIEHARFPLDRVVFVGDRYTDLITAARVPVEFQWSDDFFAGWLGNPDGDQAVIDAAIQRRIKNDY